MVKNYFVIAWRNIIKQPFYSIINISGLGIGFIAVFFIFLFVKDELSYDRFHLNREQLYRLHFFGKLGDQVISTSATPGPAGPLFSQTFPEVKAACRLRSHGVYSVKSGIKTFREPKVIFADSTRGWGYELGRTHTWDLSFVICKKVKGEKVKVLISSLTFSPCFFK